MSLENIDVREEAEWHVGLRGEIGDNWLFEVQRIEERFYITASEPLRELSLLGLAPETVTQAVEAMALREDREPYRRGLQSPANSAHQEAVSSGAPLAGSVAGSDCSPPREPEQLRRWLESGPGGTDLVGNTQPRPLREVLLHHAPHPWQVEARRSLAEDPGQCPEVLATLAEHYLPTVRARIASNPTTPEAALHRLIPQKEFPIQDRLAANPRISPEMQIVLSETNRWSLHAELLRNPNLHPEVLVNLAERGEAQTRAAVAHHPRCPSDLLLQLAGDALRSVRRHAAAAAGLTVEIRERMIPAALLDAAGDEDPLCRWIALSHPRIPPERLEAGARSLEWIDRLAVALNPVTPAIALELLREDGNSLIRAASRSRPAPPLPPS